MNSVRFRAFGGAFRFRAYSGVVFVAFLAAAWNAQPLTLRAIHFYQRALAPAAAGVGLRCRFTPTCSRYAEVVIARDGVVRGGIKAIARIARCGPWTPPGTRDDP